MGRYLRFLAGNLGALCALGLLVEFYRWDIVYWHYWDASTHRGVILEMIAGVPALGFTIWAWLRWLRGK